MEVNWRQYYYLLFIFIFLYFSYYFFIPILLGLNPGSRVRVSVLSSGSGLNIERQNPYKNLSSDICCYLYPNYIDILLHEKRV